MKNDLLWIGSDLDLRVHEFRERRSVIPVIYSAFTMPSEALLDSVDAVFVYNVEKHARYEQLRNVCQHQRMHGRIKFVLALSSNLDPRLAALVEAEGARFVPSIGGVSSDH